MKDILFTSANVNDCKLEFDLINGEPYSNICLNLVKNNFRYEGDVTLKFTSSGDFSNMTEQEVVQIVLGKLLSSGIFGKK